MGYTTLSDNEIAHVLKEISKKFVGPSYNLLLRNCNHFTEELVFMLTKRHIPGWINRAAKLGTMFPCVIPSDWVEPPDLDSDAIRSPSSSTTTTATPSTSTSSAVSCSSKTPLKSTSASRQRGNAYGSSETSIRPSSPAMRKTSRRMCVSYSYPTSRQSSTASVDSHQFSNPHRHRHRRRSSVPSTLCRRLSNDGDSIIFIRSSPVLIEDECNMDDIVKEPDCYRPEVLRSATQLSIEASFQELER
ncbi:hypothetical protein EC973_007573 [Apophysomyces ossiformis]|uniref:PPPDE domain-containing protein n=1 Tax=Apophysomyces ossiformis TaxID=679940 RepID=A0A8H7EQV4_9FUNG|nr:hypothetical protein EC973_007573 [Apophysomyces ossiformis]